MDSVRKQRSILKRPAPDATARVVYTEPPVQLGVLVAPEGDGWRVRTGARECTAAVDPSVDPALLTVAHARGARVLLECAPAPVVVGVLATRRALEMDPAGNVVAELNRLALTVRESAVIKSAQAFVQVTAADVELYGHKVVTRAREVAKILARLISLN